MANEELKMKEQMLYHKLFDMLDCYADKRSSFDPTDVASGVVIATIRKNISRCRIEKRIEILKRIINTANNGMLLGDGTRFIFHNAMDQSLREKANIKSVKKITSENKTITEKSKKELERERKEEETLIKNINSLAEMFNNADRKMMFSLEKNVNKRIMWFTAGFGLPNNTAMQDVINRLNCGMYGKNQYLMIRELESLNIKVPKTKKLSGVMNDDLFRYRLAALVLTLNVCETNRDYVKPKTPTSHYNKNEYYKALNKVSFIGKTVSKAFSLEYGLTPRESLIEDPYDKRYTKLLENSQMILDEFLEPEDVTLKRIRNSK